MFQFTVKQYKHLLILYKWQTKQRQCSNIFKITMCTVKKEDRLRLTDAGCQ